MNGNERLVSKERDKSVFYVNFKGITEEIWVGVLDTYDSFFKTGLGENRPTFLDFQSINTPNGGQIHRSPGDHKNSHFEVVTKIDGPELYVRFKGYISNSSSSSKGKDDFQDKIEEYLVFKGLKLVPHTDICRDVS
jgi:hypothetical protein